MAALPSLSVSDGAGVVEAVGEGVAEFRPGDHAVSYFFPQWQDGLPRGPVGDFAGTPGDGIDGFAAHFSVRAATAFTASRVDGTTTLNCYSAGENNGAKIAFVVTSPIVTTARTDKLADCMLSRHWRISLVPVRRGRV
jgi:hypothetical protein